MLFVEPPQLGVESLVKLLHPLVGRRIAEIGPAAERADGVDAAQAIELEGAPLAVPSLREWRPGAGSELLCKDRQFNGGHEQPVPRFLESAAPSRDGAGWL